MSDIGTPDIIGPMDESVSELGAISPVVAITCSMARYISATFHQNSVPVIHEIAVDNPTSEALIDVVIVISAEPAFTAGMTIKIDRIAAGAKHHVRLPDLPLDIGFLRRLNEGVLANVAIRLEAAHGVTAQIETRVTLHSPSHWGGIQTAPELIAAFVRPNDPAIDIILHDASSRLTAAGKNGAIDGYTAGKRERVWELASAIWSALAARAIVYVLPPASFERTGQKVRSPGEILERKTATCLDLTLLYAACVEQAGLNPLIVLSQGHAFVGLWLKKDDFSSVAVDDVQTLRKRRDLEDVICVETTLLTQAQPPRFATAVAFGAKQIEDETAAPFELAIDIRRARLMRILPLDLGDGVAAQIERAGDRPISDLGIDDAPAFVEDMAIHAEKEEPTDRLERWKRKLLDLSLRNKLLNFKDGKKSIVIECPDPGRLEDMLSDGKKFKLLPRSTMLAEGDQRDAQLFEDRMKSDGRRAFVLDALEKSEIHTSLTTEELETRSTELYRLSRSAFEEGGSNILFLALGFLKWQQKSGGPSFRAPLLLVPVSLQRSSVRAGFRLALHEDEARFNPTLLQMLRQDFELRMPEFESGLPSDQSGIDVARVWRVVRERVLDMKGWEVTSDVIVSTFSFTKFLIWKDLVERVAELKRNPVVRHLIDTPKQGYGDGSPFPDPTTIDRDHHPKDIFAPLSSDSSQLSAVLAAGKGKDFVLVGPPGTGKSQTIANLISHCLAHGKTILFVSQKTAALEVVQRRLRDIGLGEYCLEVHSTKAQKSTVLSQLKAAWHERAKPTAAEWQGATADLANLRDELNALVATLHRRRANGMTAYEAFGRVVANRERFPGLIFDWATQNHTQAERQRLIELCREIRTIAPAVGDPAAHPLKGVGPAEWSPQWTRALSAEIDAMAAAMAPVDEAAGSLGRALGLTLRRDRRGMAAQLDFAAWLNAPKAGEGRRLLNVDLIAADAALDDLQALVARAGKVREQLAVAYSPSVFREDLRQLLSDWSEASTANFLFRSGRIRKVKAALQPFASAALPEDISRDLVTLIEIRDISSECELLAPRFAALGAAWDGLDTDIVACRMRIDWARQSDRVISKAAQALGETPATLMQAATAALLAPVKVAAHTLAKLLTEADAALAQTCELAKSTTLSAIEDDWAAQTVAAARVWQPALTNRAQPWCRWMTVASDASEAGLDPIIRAIGDGTIAPNEVESAFEIAYARGWANDIVGSDKLLRNFMRVRHEDAIKRFAIADERVRELTKRVVRASLAGGIPAPTAFGADPEWGTLSRELTKRARHMPLRQLFSKIPSVLTRLTPCVMMSPLSIAQFLPPEGKTFDVVVFDEASQIPVWDAVGSIARGKQAIIVGDPEQLPPTSVGERGVDELEDGMDVEDQESILDECLAANIPRLRLDWHYRSRYESLIAFSNKEYYQGRLVTFPSPVTEDRAVRYVHVPDGVYERGKARVNRKEADAVVADVIRRLEERAFTDLKLSLGVVTFNGEQQRLIENLLDKARRDRPHLELFFDKEAWHEPVFVKNLENVQGDERDTILFSVTFAPTEGRPGISTISSLNKEGGHRRLNVAITRARHEMIVFGTLRSEQVTLSGTGARGVRDFKHFMEFAERGPRALAESFASEGETESPFEDAVKAALESKGWIVHPQIGVSGFRIDLGIVDPDAPGRYLAGIECDGARYHSSATARDRDRLRETILRQLGWRILRVWSTDWWMDRDEAFMRLQESLDANLAASRAEIAALAVEPEVAQKEPVSENVSELTVETAAADGEIVAEPGEPDVSVADNIAPAPIYAKAPVPERGLFVAPEYSPVYRATDIAASGHAPDPVKFYDVAERARVRAMVAHVIAVEGPIFDDLLVFRIARAHGFGRAAGRIREIVLGAVDRQIVRTVEEGRTIFWPPGAGTDRIVHFRACDDASREHGDVPISELAGLAALYLQTGASDDEVIRRMAMAFGLGRLREAARARFAQAVLLATERL